MARSGNWFSAVSGSRLLIEGVRQFRRDARQTLRRRRPRTSATAAMECLEARVVPTTIFVNSLEPHDFFRAVREAHRNDQDGELHDQIVLTQAGTIRLPQEVFIDTDIEIVGLGAGTTILQGRGSGRLFHIEDVGGAV